MRPHSEIIGAVFLDRFYWEQIVATGTEIPVTVTDEAHQWIAEKKMLREFEMMLEHTRQAALHLRAIEVKLEHDPSGVIPAQIVIWSYRHNPGGNYDSTDWQWGEWQVETFPPEVCLNFIMLTIYGAPHHGG
jgi:hypothetical protein